MISSHLLFKYFYGKRKIKNKKKFTRYCKAFFCREEEMKKMGTDSVHRLREHLSKDEMGQSGDHSIRHNRPATFLALSKQHRGHSREELQMDLCSLLPVQVSSLPISPISICHRSLQKDDEDLELFKL